MKNVRLILALLLAVTVLAGCGKNKKEKTIGYTQKIERERASKDSLFRIPESSPLPSLSAMDTFRGLIYFPIDSQYRVKAYFEKIEGAEPFRMQSTGEIEDIYLPYARLHFKIKGEEAQLTAYQNLRLLKDEEYQDFLFVPFRDSTSGRQSYGGGRYLDLRIPQGDSMVLDFNLAYNPYCAYNYEYSCPVPPEENTLDMAIRAGEKNFPIHP